MNKKGIVIGYIGLEVILIILMALYLPSQVGMQVNFQGGLSNIMDKSLVLIIYALISIICVILISKAKKEEMMKKGSIVIIFILIQGMTLFFNR